MSGEILVSPRHGAPDPTLLRARTLLEQAHAEASPDVRLRFDLGETYAALDDNVRAKEILQPALDAAPDHPAAVAAFIALANAYAKLDQSNEERRVYERFLPKVTDERSRSTAMLNLAEADMHLGDLESSIAGYRATIDLAAQLPNIIELDVPHRCARRSGASRSRSIAPDDVPSGAKEAKLGARSRPGHGDHPPESERLLLPRARAKLVRRPRLHGVREGRGGPRRAATWWQRAEGCWREYVDDANAHGGGDRWIDLARARLERAHAQRTIAERRVKGRIVYPQYECVR